MDYKAKYEELRSKIQNLHDRLTGELRQEIEEEVPETIESDDERMRNAAINACKYMVDNFENSTKQYEDAIAWLEKQGGEQNLTLPKWKYKNDNIPLSRDSIILNKYGCVAKSPSGALVGDVWVLDYDELAKLPKEEIEKQGEQKPVDEVGNYDHKEVLQTIINEQKPAWSEEDELHIRELESLVKQVWATAEHKNDKDTIHKMSDLSFFLKTLKPQSKQEWSEDGWTMQDEEELQIALDTLVKAGQHSSAKWLKNVCLISQNTWKPSARQIECLSSHIANREKDESSYSLNVLRDLLEQLKKLREE